MPVQRHTIALILFGCRPRLNENPHRAVLTSYGSMCRQIHKNGSMVASRRSTAFGGLRCHKASPQITQPSNCRILVGKKAARDIRLSAEDIMFGVTFLITWNTSCIILI